MTILCTCETCRQIKQRIAERNRRIGEQIEQQIAKRNGGKLSKTVENKRKWDEPTRGECIEPGKWEDCPGCGLRYDAAECPTCPSCEDAKPEAIGQCTEAPSKVVKTKVQTIDGGYIEHIVEEPANYCRACGEPSTEHICQSCGYPSLNIPENGPLPKPKKGCDCHLCSEMNALADLEESHFISRKTAEIIMGPTPDTAPKNNLAEGKPRPSLLPLDVMLEFEVAAYEEGCIKYERDSWRRGFNTTTLIDAALRHITAFMSGEDWDPDAQKLGIKKHHLAGAIWCLRSILWTLKTRPELDDR